MNKRHDDSKCDSKTKTGRYKTREEKEDRMVKALGRAVPAGSIFPASARGKYRQSGNYGRFGADGEMKFIDNLMAENLVSVSGELRPTTTSDVCTPAVAQLQTGSLNQIAQGDQTYQRNGRKVNIRKIFARLVVRLPETTVAADTFDVYRVMLILDKQANGAVTTVADVLGFTGQTVSASSFMNLENSHRYRVLADVFRTINMNAGVLLRLLPALVALLIL